MRGHLLTTTGRKLEKSSIGDFIDIVYSYAINGSEHRHDVRTAFLGFCFDFQTIEVEEDRTFQGFEKSALSMMDELDAFTAQLG